MAEDFVVAEDFVLASERGNFLDCDELDFGSFPDFLPCPPNFSNVFKIFFCQTGTFWESFGTGLDGSVRSPFSTLVVIGLWWAKIF